MYILLPFIITARVKIIPGKTSADVFSYGAPRLLIELAKERERDELLLRH
jgi:hypothetical protein